MQKREKVIGVIMAAVVVVGIMNYLPAKKKAPPGPTAPAARQTHAAPVSAGQKQAGAKKTVSEAREADLQRLVEQAKIISKETDFLSMHDPFRKQEPSAYELDLSELVLSGIMWEEQTPLALINNVPLKEGGDISGFKVEKISRNEVLLSRGGKSYNLKLRADAD